MVILDKNKPYYKGTTHVHTTHSDGIFTPKETIGIYKSRGYDFLAITDHGRFINNVKELNEEFIVLCGCEITFRVIEEEAVVHINIIFKDEETRYKYFEGNEKIKYTCNSFEEVNDILKSIEGAIITLNHPLTSYINYDDMLKLTALTNVEVYNHGSCIRANNGIAFSHYIYALSKGYNISAISTDDFHAKEHVQSIMPPVDLVDRHIGGFISVQSESITKEGIFSSIQRGKYYSSMGPEIIHLEIVNGKIYIECSAVSAIRFYANKDILKIEKGDNLTHSYMDLSLIDYFYIRAERDGVLGKTSNYLIIEIEDKDGKLAWTNNLISLLNDN